MEREFNNLLALGTDRRLDDVSIKYLLKHDGNLRNIVLIVSVRKLMKQLKVWNRTDIVVISWEVHCDTQLCEGKAEEGTSILQTCMG